MNNAYCLVDNKFMILDFNTYFQDKYCKKPLQKGKSVRKNFIYYDSFI